MIKGVRIVTNRKPSLPFMRDWSDAMAAKKVIDPTLQTTPLPHWLEIVDADGRPNDRLLQLARLFTPSLQRTQPFADADGFPTPYALSWWNEAT